jgi:TM2 domain-containing membrane protein YozV
MLCPNCGRQIPDGSKFCPYCGAKLSLAGEPEESQVQTVLSEEERKKRAYEEELLRAKAQQAARVGIKSPGVAAVLSFFFTGLGQIYNGQVGKAILFIILGTISIGLMFIGIGFILYPIIWIIGIVDAYNTAKNANDALLRP